MSALRSRTRQGRRSPGAAPSSGLLGATAVVSVAFLGANALAYVFTVVAARQLAPAAYGELAALLSVLLVGSVPAAGLQTAAALHLGGRPGDERTMARLHASSAFLAVGVCALGLVLVPVLVAALHLPAASAAVWLAALLLPHTLVQGYQGMLQGSGRYRQLALVTLVLGAGKLVGGVAGLLLGGTTSAALAGMAAAAVVAAVIGWLAVGRPGLGRGTRAPVTAALRAAGALLGFTVLLNLDVLLARHHLPAAVTGEYAVAAIVTKVAFWLPQGVGVVLLPRLADAAGRRRALPAALAAVGGLGAVLTLGTALMGERALPLIGGAAYGGTLGSATWVFAALGTLLALAQLLLFSGIAAADRLATVAVWSAAGLEAVVVALLATTDRLTLLSLATTSVLTAAALVATGLVRSRRDRAVPVLAPEGVVPAPTA
ncbi:polysaccharide biosynthesis protein [Blastococcus sp. TF02A-35]|uniref:polysaccharide biosynthesis protein n=1 Tax=Blastococcus sp. TF02A-35 TaxID=2559612 RepID=UPI0010740DA9|nr:polysaccharide biosynthesis protein [Blastococcus sp. TF02A_35]TFV51681.1 polysaccharide biosynthesis protein [Blastococcus sp. TF02A_35]